MKYLFILLFISFSIYAGPSLEDINSEFDFISEKYDIPAPILKAIAYKQSSWNVNFGKDDEINQGRYGIMGLYQDSRVSSIDYGSKLLGVSQINGLINYSLNIEMAARIIAEIKEDYVNAGDRVDDLEDYYSILIDYFDYDKSIKVFAEGLVIKIYKLINLGYEVELNGETLTVDGQSLDISELETEQVSKFYQKYTEISKLSDIQFIASPNFSSRRGTQIDQIILHIMQGYFEGTISHFKNSSSDASSHYIISQEGEIVQMVKLEDKAWHASIANSRSIGIEHAGFDGASYHSDQYITEAEYQASAMLVKWLAEKYNIPLIHRDAYHDENGSFVPWTLQRPELSQLPGILGHHDVTGKELCPGPHWDWGHYMQLLGAATSGGGDGNGEIEIIEPQPNETVNNPVTFESTATGDVVLVKYTSDGWDLGESSNASDNYKVVYSFHDIGLREIVATGYDSDGRRVLTATTTINITIVEANEGDLDEACKNDELPAKIVHLSEYKIGKKEVTVSEYKACVDAGVCVEPTGGNYVDDGKENHPVNNVTWVDAQRFCAWLGGSEGHVRLPTEAEWENAAKGLDNKLYPWGDEEPTCDLTVMEGADGVDGCGTNTTFNVGTKTTDISSYDVLDMAGNVSEYTNDYYDPAYYSKDDSLNNPKGTTQVTTDQTFIVVRGGNWSTHKVTSFRNSRRLAMKTSVKSDNTGFRCAYIDEGNSLSQASGTVDEPIELGTLNPGYTHNDSRDTNEASSDYFDKYLDYDTPEYGKEFIYHFTTTQRVRILLSIDDPEPSGTDIDLHLFRTLSATNPGLIQRNDKKIEAVIEPGEYYISMDSYGRSGNTHEGQYNLYIEVQDADASVGSCSNVSLIELDTSTLPFDKVDSKDTKNAPNDCFDMYKPFTQSEKGKEYIYHFSVDKKVEATFYIDTPQSPGVDTDLQLFTNLNSDDLGMVTRNDKYISEILEPGSYYLSLDGYTKNGVDQEGSYKLTISLREYNQGGSGTGTIASGDLLNPYIVSAAQYMDDNYHLKGYDLGSNYTHDLYFKGKNSSNTVYMTGPIHPITQKKTYSQCIGAVHEALLIGMKDYYDATNDEKTYSIYPASKWFGSLVPILYQWAYNDGTCYKAKAGHCSRGITTHIKDFNLGRVLSSIKDASPGTAVHLDRLSGGGHSVILMSFIDKFGREYKTYQTDKKMVGFKYMSANGYGRRKHDMGVSMVYLILKDYLKLSNGSYVPTLPDLVTFCNTHKCDKSPSTMFLGDYYIPSKWVK